MKILHAFNVCDRILPGNEVLVPLSYSRCLSEQSENTSLEAGVIGRLGIYEIFSSGVFGRTVAKGLKGNQLIGSNSKNFCNVTLSIFIELLGNNHGQ